MSLPFFPPGRLQTFGRFLILALSLGLIRGAPAAEPGAPQPDRAALEFFETHIRPVLIEHCYECHSGQAKKPKGGLRLDSRDGLRKGGESGPAFVPGKPEDSLLIQVVRHVDSQPHMPPKKKLPEAVIADLVKWVAMGAPDPRDRPPSAAEVQRQTWEVQLNSRRGWWSLQPVQKQPLPAVKTTSWPANPVDRFVLAKLEANGLQPAARAERAVLVRRLSFVLTGLPPTPDQVAAFVEDGSPGAYDRVVDRLLASPHFGERWARHWMDVVRYGDTYGYEWDIAAKGAWRYRDYLVRALNGDVSFDQLMREHLAGDLLEKPRLNHEEQINESLIGPLFYQLGENRHGDSAEFNGIHQEMLNNKIEAFSKAFQATTIACARCHDHKIDAVSQRDYYALAGVFMSSHWVTNTLDLPERNRPVLEQLRAIKPRLRGGLAAWWLEEIRSPGKWQKLSGDPKAKELPLEHPLYPWLQLAKAGKANQSIEKAWQTLAAKYAEGQKARTAENAKDFQVVADFRRGVPPGWSADGVGLRDGPVPCGDFTVALDGPAAIGGLLTGGLFTHSLSPRLNGALRTPYLNTFNKPFIHFEACGGDFSTHRTVVDNAFLTERQVYLNHARPTWTQLSTFPDMKDRRIYIELATKTSNPNFPPRVGLGGRCTEEQARDPRSWFGISRVLLSDKLGAPADDLSRFQKLFQGQPPRDLNAAAQRIGQWFAAALHAWASNQANADDVQLINWLLDQGLLPNRHDDPAHPEVRTLVEAYRRTEARLSEAQTINGMADIDAGYDYRFNIRGVYEDLGDPVPRGYVQVLSHSSGGFLSPGSGRRELAELVASPRNPLTARVFVNRVWHWVFGTGLVATPDDFGRLGERPSHPELLDFLADWFVDHGWSVKELVRLLVTSATFQQGGDAVPSALEVDPRNRLLHHYPLQRLEAEAIRDAMLAASGRLDHRLYGPPVDPPRPKEDPEKRLFSGPLDGLGRRSLYTKITIMEPPKLLASFNQPNPKIPTGQRDVTNVPAQALALLNDPFVHGQAAHWAKQLTAASHATVQDRLAAMFRVALGREPSQPELARWSAAVTELAVLHGTPADSILKSEVVWKDLAHAVFNLKEFLYVR